MSTDETVGKLLSTARVQRERNRRRGEALLRRIERLRVRLSRDFYEVGRALVELSQPPIYGALGYDSFGELLEQRQVMSRTQAGRLVDVVQAFPKEQALALGVEKAYGLLRYAAATAADDVATVLASTNAKIGGKRVRALSTRELAAFTRKLLARRSGRDPALKTAARRARAVERRVKTDGAPSAVVTVRRALGRPWVRIEVPLEELDALFPAGRARSL
jgi:hypothetical protein